MIGFAPLAALLAAGAQPAAVSKAPPAPIDFGAVTMTLEPKDNRTFLDGDVWLQRFDLRVTGNKAVAEFTQDAPPDKRKPQAKKSVKAPPEPKPDERGLSSFVVDGAVHVERPSPSIKRTADGDHAVYDGPGQTLLLTGAPVTPPPFLASVVGPVLREGKELMVGERVLLHLDTDEVEVWKPRLFMNRSLPGVDQSKPADPNAQQAVPVRVESGTMRLDQQRKVARFRERCVVHRGDLTVKSPRLDARYDDKGELTTLQFRGGVTMVEGDRRAVGKQADYDASTRILILTGDPKLYDRGDVLRGDRIEMLLDSHEIKVDRAHGRLRPEQHKDEQNVLGKKPPPEVKP